MKKNFKNLKFWTIIVVHKNIREDPPNFEVK